MIASWSNLNTIMWPFSRSRAGGGTAPQVTVKLVNAKGAHARMKHGAKLIDVRTPREFRALHPKDAINVPPQLIKQDQVGLERDAEILVICMSGRRSTREARRLTKLGYTNVTEVLGGLNDWVNFGLPVRRSR